MAPSLSSNMSESIEQHSDNMMTINCENSPQCSDNTPVLKLKIRKVKASNIEEPSVNEYNTASHHSFLTLNPTETLNTDTINSELPICHPCADKVDSVLTIPECNNEENKAASCQSNKTSDSELELAYAIIRQFKIRVDQLEKNCHELKRANKEWANYAKKCEKDRSNNDKSNTSKLENEVEILKQQLAIYKDDFAMERRDRVRAVMEVRRLRLENERRKNHYYPTE